MRIVLDSNILVRAFVSRHGSAHQLLLEILAGDHTLLLSNEILHEVAKVLRHPRLMSVHARNEEEIYQFVESLREFAVTVLINPLVMAPVRDRNDIFVLQTALGGEADMLCTLDRDFFSPPASDFLAIYGVAVLTDTELLPRLRG